MQTYFVYLCILCLRRKNLTRIRLFLWSWRSFKKVTLYRWRIGLLRVQQTCVYICMSKGLTEIEYRAVSGVFRPIDPPPLNVCIYSIKSTTVYVPAWELGLSQLVMATISKRRQNEASIFVLFSISKRNEPAYSRTCKERSEANPAYSTP
jgi:hypothetical protein